MRPKARRRKETTSAPALGITGTGAAEEAAALSGGVMLSEAKDLCNLPAAPRRRQVAQVPSTSSGQALRPAKRAGLRMTRRLVRGRDGQSALRFKQSRQS